MIYRLPPEMKIEPPSGSYSNVSSVQCPAGNHAVTEGNARGAKQ